MKPLEKKLILGADGKTMVYVYDYEIELVIEAPDDVKVELFNR